MSIGSRELRELSSAIAGTVPKERAATVTRGVVTSTGDGVWVLLDGADTPTPVQTATCAVSPGDQVSVRIQDGSATVTGNVTQPAQTASTVAAAVEPVKKVADSNTATIMQTNKDLASANTKIVQVSQDLSGFKTIVSDTYETKTAAARTKTTLETSIKQTDDAVALKAAKTDLDKATDRLSKAETSIKANADQISLRATKTEVPGLVSVRSQNLLSDSEFSKVGTLWITDTGVQNLMHHSPILSKKPDGTEFQSKHAIHAKFTGVSNQRFYHGPTTTNGGFNHVVGKTYTMTFWARAEAQCTFAYGYNGKSVISKTLPASKAWVYYSVTYTANATTVPSWYCSQAVEIYMTEPMLVEGNVSVPWSPTNIQDRERVESAKQAAIDVSADAIKSFVESAGGKTTYKQTDTGFTWTTTSPMTQVADSTARTNASNAAAAASSAATAASNAATAATKAQTTANNASSAASAAQTTADTANSTAESANKAAGEAKTAAADAAKTATAFMDYGETEAGALTIGHRSDGKLAGARAKLLADRLSFESEDGTELSRFGADGATIGPPGSAVTTINADGMDVSNAGNPIARLGKVIELYTNYGAGVGGKKSKITIADNSLSLKSGVLSAVTATTGEPVFGSYSENVIDTNGMTQRQYDKNAGSPIALLRFGPNAATYAGAKTPGIGSHMGSFDIFVDNWGPNADSVTDKEVNNTGIHMTTNEIKFHSSRVFLGTSASATFLSANTVTGAVTFSDISESDIDTIWDAL